MRKDKVIRLRCTEEEFEDWTAEATSAKLSLSDLVRARMQSCEEPDPKNEMPKRSVATKKSVATPMRVECSHKPFKRRDGLMVCEKCGVRL